MKEADVWPGYFLCKKNNNLYKRIVTKFFWDYCLNRVCNNGKRVVIGLL